MSFSGDFDDLQRFVDELTEKVETGMIEEDGEVSGFDTTVAVTNILELLTKWGLIYFMDEN